MLLSIVLLSPLIGNKYFASSVTSFSFNFKTAFVLNLVCMYMYVSAFVCVHVYHVCECVSVCVHIHQVCGGGSCAVQKTTYRTWISPATKRGPQIIAAYSPSHGEDEA